MGHRGYRVERAWPVDVQGRYGVELVGVDRLVVESRPDLAWMLEVELGDAAPAYDEGETVWLDAGVWDARMG